MSLLQYKYRHPADKLSHVRGQLDPMPDMTRHSLENQTRPLLQPLNLPLDPDMHYYPGLLSRRQVEDGLNPKHW
jgi:hypothetical protein